MNRVFLLLFCLFVSFGLCANEGKEELLEEEVKPEPVELSREDEGFLDELENEFSGTIMFKNSDLKELYDIIKNLKNSAVSSGPIFHNRGNESDLATKAADIKISPSIYMNSLLYKPDGSWVVWINKRKFTENTVKSLALIVDSLSLDEISEEKIILSFETNFLDRLSPNWLSELEEMSGKYVSKDRKIIVKQKSNGKVNVKFEISPNQTFVLHDMKIVEGKSPSVRLPEIKPKEIEPREITNNIIDSIN